MSSAVSERHRASRSSRCLAAAALIVAMAALTIVALFGSISTGLVLAVDFGLATLAAGLLHSVVIELRRQSARDRALAAARSAEQARSRAREHLAYTAAMGDQLRAARVEAEHLAVRTRELEAQLSMAQSELAELRDALWISEAAEKRARAALVIAEENPAPGRHLRPA